MQIPRRMRLRKLLGAAWRVRMQAFRGIPPALFNGTPQNREKSGIDWSGRAGGHRRLTLVGVGTRSPEKPKARDVAYDSGDDSNDIHMHGAAVQKSNKKRPRYRKRGLFLL